jgi:hypothetical protein
MCSSRRRKPERRSRYSWNFPDSTCTFSSRKAKLSSSLSESCCKISRSTGSRWNTMPAATADAGSSAPQASRSTTGETMEAIRNLDMTPPPQ